MTQYSLKAGLKQIKQKSIEATMEELRQLHMHESFEPIVPANMNAEDKQKALERLMFLKEK